MAVDRHLKFRGWTHLLFRPAAQVGRKLARGRRCKGYSCRASRQLTVSYASSYRRTLVLAATVSCAVEPRGVWMKMTGSHHDFHHRGAGAGVLCVVGVTSG